MCLILGNPFGCFELVLTCGVILYYYILYIIYYILLYIYYYITIILSYTILFFYLLFFSSSFLPLLSLPLPYLLFQSFPYSPLLSHLIHSIRVGTSIYLFIFLYNIQRQSSSDLSPILPLFSHLLISPLPF